MDDDKAIAKRVFIGDVLQPPRDLKLTIMVDGEAVRRASQAIEQAKLALAGMATPVARWNRSNERDIIDQE